MLVPIIKNILRDIQPISNAVIVSADNNRRTPPVIFIVLLFLLLFLFSLDATSFLVIGRISSSPLVLH